MFWVKIENNDSLTTNWNRVFKIEDEKSDRSSTGLLRCETCYGSAYAADHPARGTHWHDNATYAITNYSSNNYTTADRGIWHHVALAVDSDSGLWAYTDGSLVGSTTTVYGGHLLDDFYLGETNNISGVMNDLRIYDTVLSLREIKEVSKGLVCHYTLAKNGGDNLITGYDTSFATIPNGTTTLFTNQMNGGAQEVVSNIGGAEKCLHLHSNGAQSRQYRTLGAQTGKIYTVSADYYSTTSQPSALRLELNGGNYSWFGINSVYDTPGEWRRVSCTTPSLTSDTTIFYFFYCNANQDCYIKNIKIEENSVATPWTPNQSDSLYAKLGLNDAIEYDISGYGHNGTKVGTISYDTDSPKYWTSTYLASGANYINCGRGGMVTDAITVNIWFNATTMYNPISCTEGGGWNFENGGNIQFPIYISGVGYVVATSPNVTWASLQNSGWHMVTGTYDRTNVKLYIDGVLNTTIAASSGNDISYHGGNCIFIGAEAGGTTTPATTNFVGSVSDARIYATALSADDIKELYDTPISLASNGNLMTSGEYTEV